MWAMSWMMIVCRLPSVCCLFIWYIKYLYFLTSFILHSSPYVLYIYMYAIFVNNCHRTLLVARIHKMTEIILYLQDDSRIKIYQYVFLCRRIFLKLLFCHNIVKKFRIMCSVRICEIRSSFCLLMYHTAFISLVAYCERSVV